MSILPFTYDFERPFRLMDREILPRQFSDFSDFSPFNQLLPAHFAPEPFFKPWENALQSWNNVFKPLEELSSAMSHLALRDVNSSVTSNDEKFQINIDVQHFAPEEISVKVINKHVVVEGKHEEKRDEHGYVSRQFVRRYELPQGCLPDTVESSLSSDGVLSVTAPKVLRLPSIGEKIVPITHTGPVKRQISSPVSEIKECD